LEDTNLLFLVVLIISGGFVRFFSHCYLVISPRRGFNVILKFFGFSTRFTHALTEGAGRWLDYPDVLA
jgi:hypothetical protein